MARDAEVSLRDIVSVLARRRYLVLGVTACCVALACLATGHQRRENQAVVTLLDNTTPPPAAMEHVPAVIEALSFQPRGAETHRKLLEDPNLATRAAEKLGLAAPALGPKAIRATVVADTECVTVSLFDPSPQRAAELANGVAKLYVDDSVERARRAARTSAEYIAKQLDETRGELERAEASVRDYKTEQRVADLPSELTTYTGMLAALESQAVTAEADAVSSRRMADQYRGMLRQEKQTVVSATTVARNPMIAELDSQLNTLELERAGQAASRGTQHPEIKRLDQRIAETRERLSRAVATVVDSEVKSTNPVYTGLVTSLATAEAGARAAQARRQALEAVLHREEQRLAAMPAIQAELARRQRDADIASQMYQSLAQQYHELKVQEALISPTVEVVSPATVPTAPARPSLAVNLAIGLLLGLLLSAMIAGMTETLDDAIRTSWQAQAAIGLPSLAVVPKALVGNALLAADGYSLEVSDAFRTLRTNLRLAVPSGTPSAMMIASPRRGDGRTTVAVNLGVALAQSGKRVVVVDADLRNPSLHRLLGVAAYAGLTDSLLQTADAVALVQPTRVPGLYALPSGPIPPNATDLLEGDRMRAVIDSLHSAFDIVIIDSSPVAQAPEAVALATLCAATLEVVRVGATPMRVAQGVADKLARAGSQPLGFIFNQVRVKRGDR